MTLVKSAVVILLYWISDPCFRDFTRYIFRQQSGDLDNSVNRGNFRLIRKFTNTVSFALEFL